MAEEAVEVDDDDDDDDDDEVEDDDDDDDDDVDDDDDDNDGDDDDDDDGDDDEDDDDDGDDDKDDDDDGHALSRLNKITLELLCIFTIGSIFTFFRGAIFNTAGERVVARVRRRLFSAILAQGK